MLNLDPTKPISFSPGSQAYLLTLRPYAKGHWDKTTKKMKIVKQEIKDQLITIQANRCAYCICDLDDRVANVGDMQLDGDREHIADKGNHPEFMFEELNLVLSCHVCNRILKHTTNVVTSKNPHNYQNCQFNIVHPYLDDYTNHIIFDQNMVLCKGHRSPEGLNTIQMFQLDGDWLTKERGKTYAYNRRSLLTRIFENLRKKVLQYK